MNASSTNGHLYSALDHGGDWANPTSGERIDRMAVIERLRLRMMHGAKTVPKL